MNHRIRSGKTFSWTVCRDLVLEAISVTAEGFCEPHAVSFEDIRKFDANGHKSDDSCSCSFQVFADMPQEMQQRWMTSRPAFTRAT